MLIIGLDDKEYKWNVSKYAHNERSTASSGHIKTRELLKEIFPFDKVYEEVPLPGTGRQPLYADFFIPTRRLMIEIHGVQHFSFTPFFHKNKIAFYKAKTRDRNKQNWCDNNDIQLVILKDTDTEDEWREQIVER